MDPIRDSQAGAIALLSRRRLITLGLTAAGMVVLPGCGGSGGGGGRSGNAAFVTVSGNVVLPAGLSPAGLTFLSGGSETGVGGTIKARVLPGAPTIATVLDNASGRVVLLGMIDPAAAPFTLGPANVAATLLFLAFGGTQLTLEDRQALWTTLVADSATATFATVVTTRLAADPFALENGDPTLLAALQTAIQNSGGRPSGRSPNPPVRSLPPQKRLSRGEVIRPTPAVKIDFNDSNSSVINGALHHAQLGNDTVPDLLGVTNLNALDTALYAYHTVFSGGTATSVSRLLGPTVVPASRTALTEFGPIAISLENPEDSVELMSFVSLTPIFDAPAAPALSDPLYAGEADGWRTQLSDLWKRSVVQLATDLAYDAIGWRQSDLSSPALTTALANLSQIGGAEAALAGAAQGTNFSANVDLLTDFASHDVLSASTFLDAIKPLAPVAETPSAFRLAQMRGVLRIANLDGLFTSASTYGRIYAQAVYTSSHEAGPTVNVLNGHSLKRLILKLTPANATYTQGGAGIVFTLDDDGLGYLEPYQNKIVYRWKVFGAGDVKITDGTKVGTDFESTSRTVTLTTGSSTTGVVSVSAEPFSTAGGGKFALGKATGSVNSGAGTRFALTPVESHILIGKTGGWTVSLDGNVTMSGWTGVDPNHLSFRWEIDSSDFGRLGVSSPTGTVVTTTTNAVQYFPNLDSTDGSSTNLTVTISAVDPSTGDFTNLAVLHGKAISDVRTGLQFEIGQSNFPLSDLRFPDPIRMLVNRSVNLAGTDEVGPYVGVTYAHEGSSTLDFLSLVFRSSANFAEATQLTIDPDRSAVVLACITGVPPFDAAIVGSSAVVMEAVRNTSGALTFLKVTGNLNFAESGGRQRTLSASFTGGFGTPPY